MTKGGSEEPPFARRSCDRRRYFLLAREGAGAVRTGVGAGRPPPGDAVLGPPCDDAPIELPPPNERPPPIDGAGPLGPGPGGRYAFPPPIGGAEPPI